MNEINEIHYFTVTVDERVYENKRKKERKGFTTDLGSSM